MAKLLQVADSLEMNELHRAVQENRLEAVKFLVKRGADVTYPINKDQTPLYIAVKSNYQDITEVLCQSLSRAGVRRMIDRKTLDTETTAVHLAARNNSLESTRFLLSCGANFEIRDKESRQIQDFTTDESIKQLIKSIENVFELTASNDNQALLDKLNSIPAENVAAVMYARNQQPLFQQCSTIRQDHTLGHTALQTAMTNNDLSRVEIITNFRIDKLKQADWQAGANIDKFVQHSKAARRHLSNLNGLRTHGDSTYMKREGAGLLCEGLAFLQAYKNQVDPFLDNQPLLLVIEEVLEHFNYWVGANVMESRVEDMMRTNSAYTIQMLKLCVIAPMLLFMKSVYTSELLEAAKKNDSAKVEKYLTGHPDLNKTDNVNGWTALHHAIRHKNDKMAKLLLNLGADPTITNKKTGHKGSPLHMALQSTEGCMSWNSSDVLMLLFENTSDDKLIHYVNARTDNQLLTPLHIAAKQNNYRLAEFLLRKGSVYCSRSKSNEWDYGFNTPSSYSRDAIFNLLKCIEKSFTQARDGKVDELVQAMKGFDTNILLAVGGARNDENLTLDQVLDLEGHADEAAMIRKMLADASEAQAMITCKRRRTDTD